MKQAKPLTKEKYLSKFSRAVRWRLPPQEAEDAISDYRELIFQEERDESKLVEELGEPVQAAHLLTDVKSYRRWLCVFCVLAVGLFLLGKWCFTGHSRFWGIFWLGQEWFPVLVMAVGLPLSLIWFWRYGQKSGPLSKRLLLALAVVLAFAVGTMALTYHVTDPKFLDYIAALDYYPHQHIRLLADLMFYGGTACAFAALAGLFLARCQDRRWLALYTLALTAAALCGFVTFWFHSMDITYAQMSEIQRYLVIHLFPVGAVGLIGTGVALC